MIRLLVLVLLLLSPLCPVSAETPEFKDLREEIYKTVGDTKLKLHIFGATDPAKPKPAIVFFFGGGWSSGSPAQFENQARHFAGRGMIAITADYRVKSRQNAKPVDCVSDATQLGGCKMPLRLALGSIPREPHAPCMESHEWRERSEEGLRFWRATRHAGKWSFQTTLKTDPDWQPIDPVPRETWEALRDVLWRKYQRKRCPWEWVDQIDKLLEEEYS